MPRKSPFRIELSADEAAALRRRAAEYTLPTFEVVRAKMILLAAQGRDNDEIAARLDTRRQIIEPGPFFNRNGQHYWIRGSGDEKDRDYARDRARFLHPS